MKGCSGVGVWGCRCVSMYVVNRKIRMEVCGYLGMKVCRFLSVCMYVRRYLCTCACSQVCPYVCVSLCTCMLMCMRMCMCVCVRM